MEVIKKLSRLNEDNDNKEGAIFYLRIADKYAKGEEKLNILRKLTSLLPSNMKLKKKLYDNFITLGKKEDAVFTFFDIAENETNLSDILTPLLPLIKKDIQNLTKVSKYLKGKSINDTVAYQYFYTLGKTLFEMGKKPEGMKWLITSHRINKLPLNDYLQLGNYVADMPGAPEKELIAKSLYGYMDTVKDASKIKQIVHLLLKLKPGNKQYIMKELHLLDQEGNRKELARALLEFVGLGPVNYADFVYGITKKVVDQFDTKQLIKIAQFLEGADHPSESVAIYKLVLEREPDSKEALLNMFVVHLENEEADNIVSFFDRFEPSHLFSSSLESVIGGYEEKRSKDALDYNTHYILGFLYFAVERYEEAIAAFQFVTRSKHYVPLMSLFLGMSFDKIGLLDFAMKHYEKGLSYKDISDGVKANLLYRMALLKRTQGAITECRGLLKEALIVNPNFESAKNILSSLPEKGKVIRIEGGED